jgi:hypothetical protein
MVARDNDVGASPRLRFRGDYWKAVDTLPAPLRAVLHEGVLDWDARVCAWEYRKALKLGVPNGEAVALCVHAWREADRNEVMLFAGRHAKRYGHATPHVRAGASIQRYGARG